MVWRASIKWGYNRPLILNQTFIDMSKSSLLFNYVLPRQKGKYFSMHSNPELMYDLKLHQVPFFDYEFRNAFVYEILYSEFPIASILNYQMAGKTKSQLIEMKNWIREFMKIKPDQLQYFFDDCIPLPDEDLDYRSNTFIYSDKRDEVLDLIEDHEFLGELRKPRTKVDKPFKIIFQSEKEKEFETAFVNLLKPNSQVDFELFLSGEKPIKPIVVKRNKKEFILYFLALEMKELLVGEDDSPLYGLIPFLLSKYFVIDEINAGSSKTNFDSNYVGRILSEHRNPEFDLRPKLAKYKPLKEFLFCG